MIGSAGAALLCGVALSMGPFFHQVSSGTAADNHTSPSFSIVPLEAGNYGVIGSDFRAVADSGRPIVFGGDPGDPVSTYILDRPGGRPRRLELPSVSNVNEQLSGDGARLFLEGAFPVASGGVGFGIGTVDVSDGRVSSLRVSVSGVRSTVSRTGRWLAYVGSPPGAPPDSGRQVVLHDAYDDSFSLLTTRLAPGGQTVCNRTAPFPPLVTADGSAVVFVAPDPINGPAPAAYGTCRVWVYELASGRTRMVREIAAEQTIIWPGAVDAVGRWLSFTLVRPMPDGRRLSGAALLDLQSGEFIESLTRDDTFQSYDAVVTRDGTKVLLSSMSDLDPRVGNLDHNMELFLYHIATERFAQVTDTTGGIEPGIRGTCSGYRPGVDATGDVAVLLLFAFDAGDNCIIPRPQRQQSNGLYYRLARTLRKRPGNHPATLTGLPALVEVRVGETLTLRATGVDADGDALTFFAQEIDKLDVPRGAVIEDHYDGSASFRWQPRLEQAGEYVVRFALFDEGGGETLQDVRIRVAGGGGEGACAGDCDGDGQVVIDEVVRAVEMALGGQPAARCAAADTDGDGQVTVDELIAATGAALRGCP